MPCAAGTRTSVSGIVYDPAGKVPLYNVIVYVPNQAPAPFAAGATCDRCSASDLHAVVSTLTDTHGHFVLNDVPVGTDIPLVIQIGKWRRQTTIATVPRCTDTPTPTSLTDPKPSVPRHRVHMDRHPKFHKTRDTLPRP